MCRTSALFIKKVRQADIHVSARYHFTMGCVKVRPKLCFVRIFIPSPALFLMYRVLPFTRDIQRKGETAMKSKDELLFFACQWLKRYPNIKPRSIEPDRCHSNSTTEALIAHAKFLAKQLKGLASDPAREADTEMLLLHRDIQHFLSNAGVLPFREFGRKETPILNQGLSTDKE